MLHNFQQNYYGSPSISQISIKHAPSSYYSSRWLKEHAITQCMISLVSITDIYSKAMYNSKDTNVADTSLYRHHTHHTSASKLYA